MMNDQLGGQVQAILGVISAQKVTACVAYYKMTVTNGQVNTFATASITIPANATYALCVVEGHVGDTGAVIRYSEATTSAVSTSNGIPRPDGTAFSVSTLYNLKNFQIYSTNGNDQTLHVQFYE